MSDTNTIKLIFPVITRRQKDFSGDVAIQILMLARAQYLDCYEARQAFRLPRFARNDVFPGGVQVKDTIIVLL
jgi:hypothetical protein